LRVVGMQTDSDGERNRSFTPEEEEEFLTMSRRPNLYEEFASSIAPSIYGSPGISDFIVRQSQLILFFRYQEGHLMSALWWLQENSS
jgi:DNA replicative helicase MCM subunit Mcm2 (Cdc46/Mcm family)